MQDAGIRVVQERTSPFEAVHGLVGSVDKFSGTYRQECWGHHGGDKRGDMGHLAHSCRAAAACSIAWEHGAGMAVQLAFCMAPGMALLHLHP